MVVVVALELLKVICHAFRLKMDSTAVRSLSLQNGNWRKA